jgi:uncharacterized protein YdiU (UPF0061 family)
VIAGFADRFEKEFMKMMGKKLGLTSIRPEDQDLINSILNRLTDRRLDYTVTFDLLTQSLMSEAAASQINNELGECFNFWLKRLNEQHAVSRNLQELMRQHNPVVIPRNHHVEAVIQECEQAGEVTSAEKFLGVLRSPYEELPQTSEYQDPPSDGDKDYQTFCGT